jgi:hypothetical protein
MDYLRELDPAQLGELSFSAFKSHWTEVSVDSGSDESILPPAILKLMYAFVKDRDVSLYARVHQLLQFPLRPDILTKTGHAELEVAVTNKFADLEYKLGLRTVVPDPYGFFQKYLKDYNPWADFIPKFSNGSARVSSEKNSNFWFDKLAMMENCSLTQFLEQCADEDPQSVRKLYASQFFPVPKDSSKMRGITIEPADRTFLQQAYLRSLRAYIRRHPYLSKRINFWQPELNKDLAYEGSITGEFATIDLSDASDSVLWNQVCDDCDNLPLLEALKQVRSPQVELPDGSRLSLAKFAGMGNALTFPIECLEFCKIVEQGIRDAGGSVSKSRYRVYGDDIIVESIYYDAVVNALEYNGFKVNKTKSFNSQVWRFRESCGGEYLDGQDVCPVRLPRGPLALPNRKKDKDHDTVDYTWVPTYIDIANSCFEKLPSVRLYIIHLILNRLPEELYPVFTKDGSTGLRSDSATNYHLKRRRLSQKDPRRRDLGYQQVLVHGTLKTVREDPDPKITDDVQYEYRLLQMALRSDPHSYIDVSNWKPLAAFSDEAHQHPYTMMLMEGLETLLNESVDIVSRPLGSQWVVTTDPDYYSG